MERSCKQNESEVTKREWERIDAELEEEQLGLDSAEKLGIL